MIGVFDSGLGGLTILRTLLREFEDEKFLYFGDSAYAPYGRRDHEQIYSLTRRGVEYLFSKGCRLVIIACNTACAIALRPLQQNWLPFVEWGEHHIKRNFMGKITGGHQAHNVIGVFIPLIEAITHQEWHLRPHAPYAPSPEIHRVAFFATRATVTSERFPIELKRFHPNIQIFQQACHRLADFIEADAAIEDIDGGIQRYCKNLMIQTKARGFDIAALGCTHYQLVAELFRKHLPEGSTLIHQPQAVADSLHRYLDRHPEYRNHPSQHLVDASEIPKLRFATSGHPAQVSVAATRFWGANVEFMHKDDVLGLTA